MTSLFEFRYFSRIMISKQQQPEVVRKVLIHAADFKVFWQSTGPFRYALTSMEYPPVLLEPDEWVFSNDPVLLLKDLMQFNERKMAFVKAPFSPESKSSLKPETLLPWRINSFCEEWSSMGCDFFTPMGYLTRKLTEPDESMGAAQVEELFFKKLEISMDSMGYKLLKPSDPKFKTASVHAYLKEWEQDDSDAGFA